MYLNFSILVSDFLSTNLVFSDFPVHQISTQNLSTQNLCAQKITAEYIYPFKIHPLTHLVALCE